MIIQSHLYDRVYVFTPQMVAYHCLEMLIKCHSTVYHTMSSLNVCCASGGHETILLLYFTENFRASHHHWVFVSVTRRLFYTIIAQNNKIIFTVVIKVYCTETVEQMWWLKHQRVNRALITPRDKQCLQIMNSHLVQFNSILIESNKTLPFHFSEIAFLKILRGVEEGDEGSCKGK